MKKAAALLLLGLAGCGTLMDVGGCDPRLEGPNPHIFGGLRTDVDYAFGGLCCVAGSAAPFFLIDLPLSAAGDVAMLPITIPVALFAAKPE